MLDPDDLKRILRLERQVEALRLSLLASMAVTQDLLVARGDRQQAEIIGRSIDALKTLVPARHQNG